MPVCMSELSRRWGNGLSPAQCQAMTWANADLLQPNIQKQASVML